ncbi:hypothetical protein JYU34_022685, partial [Plutella xylostella]
YWLTHQLVLVLRGSSLVDSICFCCVSALRHSHGSPAPVPYHETCGGFCYVAGSPRVYRGSPDREGAHPAPHEQACSTPIVPLPIVMAGYGCVVSHPDASNVDCRHCESVCHCDCAVHENGSSRHHGNVVGCLYLRVSRCFAREPVAG